MTNTWGSRAVQTMRGGGTTTVGGQPATKARHAEGRTCIYALGSVHLSAKVPHAVVRAAPAHLLLSATSDPKPPALFPPGCGWAFLGSCLHLFRCSSWPLREGGVVANQEGGAEPGGGAATVCRLNRLPPPSRLPPLTRSWGSRLWMGILARSTDHPLLSPH